LAATEDIDRTLAKRAEALLLEQDASKARVDAVREQRKEEEEDLRLMRETLSGSGASGSVVSGDSRPILFSSGDKLTARPVLTTNLSQQYSYQTTLSAAPVTNYLDALRVEKPIKVIKQTVRRVRDDGTEVVTVRYLLASSEVHRVEAQLKQQKELASSGAKRLYGQRLIAQDDAQLTQDLPASLHIKLKVVSILTHFNHHCLLLFLV
jgi:hypothetical protein